MKKKLLLASVLLSIPITMAAITGSGLNDSALGSLYCALTGCTMTGAIFSNNRFSSENTAGSNIMVGNTSNNLYSKMEPEQFYSSRHLFLKTSLDIPYQGQYAGTCLGSGESCTSSSECCNTGSSCPGTCSGNSSYGGDIFLETNSTVGYIYLDANAGTDEVTVGNSSVAVLANDVTFERTTSGNNLLMVTNSSDAHASGVRMITDSAGAASTAGTLGIRRNSTTDTSQLHLTMDTISGIEGITVFRTGPTRIRGVDVPSAFCDSSTADDEDENGAMWYMQTDDGSALCICMYDGSAYEVKATLTLGTFDDDDCQL